uniref:Apolipoprotein M n=1 Tax=Nothobranchius furzeri TaxID=105023 RepID=A0A8C6LU54_NOTFU
MMLPISAVSAVLFLSLMSVSSSAPLDCSHLLRPLHQLDPHLLEGRRAMVAGSLSYLPLMEPLARRDSAAAIFSNSTTEGTLTFSRSLHLNGTCHYSSYNISLEGRSFAFDSSRVTATFTHTSCRDCILLSFDVESGKRQHFYLFSRRRQLEQEEMEEFRAQVECLNMPPPAVMDPTKELCPAEETRRPSAQTDTKKD